MLAKLFEPGKIGDMKVKNRIALAPLGREFTFGTKPMVFLLTVYWLSMKPGLKAVRV